MKPILDSQKQSEICAILTIGGTRRMAADYVGCHPRTIKRTAERDPIFAERLIKTELSPEIKFLKQIADAADDKRHWRAAAWALQHMYPSRYHNKPDVVSVDLVSGMIQHVVQAAMQHAPDTHNPKALQRKLTSLAKNAIKKLPKK